LHVDAASLALLLTGGVPFFIGNGTVSKVHLQSGHLGWKTDDLLIEAAEGVRSRKVAIQVKRTFTVSVGNEECAATFLKAFSDFRNGKLFNPDQDRLGLVATTLSGKTIRTLRSLLDCARSALSSDDMIHRLGLPEYLGKPTLDYYNAIVEIFRGVDTGAPSQNEIWRFFRVFDVVSLDLTSPGSTVEALLKSLLAATVTDGSATAAEDTWNELVVIASQGSGTAASFDREKLLASMRERHRPIAGEDAAGLARLAEDTAIVGRDVKTTIAGHVELPRRELLGKLHQLMEENQVVLVTGESGSGKSALAKRGFESLREGRLGVAFRSESLAGPHINQTLFPHGLTLSKLSCHFAVHGPKIFWIESAERLLEREERAAFRDLLHAIKADATWKLIVTCRDYSVETIKSAFFDDVGLPSVRLAVLGLEDGELDEVARALPALSRPLSDDRLRRLLKKPFLLDKAAQMRWSPEEPLPQNEREFRSKVWREAIRREDEASGGMPQRRGAAFIEVALRRARALEPFVAGDDLDPDALFRLRRDSLVVSAQNELALAPAHDVLEDWALLHWLDSEFEKTGRNLREFFNRIGTYPAVRRAYRKWLRESLDADPKTTDGLILDVVCDSTIPVHWREDTMVGVLLSKDGGEFLRRNKSALLKDHAALFRQVVHLLRVACKTDVPRNELGLSGEGDVFLPSGQAWSTAAEVLEQGMSEFADEDAQLVIGFVEDWVLLTRWGIPYPKGSRSIAKIVLHWLSKFNSWRDNDEREQLLKVLLSIPLAAATEINMMVDQALGQEHPGREEETLLDLIFNHLYGNAVCRDLVEVTVRVAEHLLEMDATQRARRNSRNRRPTFERREVEHAFGFERRFTHEDFPPSAYNGPYLRLLWNHPSVGVNFILRLLNMSCDAYGDSQNEVEFVEPPIRVVIELPDGTTQEQWGNSRLWGLYRGHTVGPFCIQSALMALERWLLDKAEHDDADLPRVLTLLLKQSNNVAITAVVASITLAYPYKVGDAGYSLLTCRDFFHADVERMVGDQSSGFVPSGFRGEDLIYREERLQAGRLPHRERDLRQVAVILQTTPLREKILALIDRYKSELPSEAEQDDEIRTWRLQLHDMDTRHYVVTGQTDEGRLMFQPTTPPPDLQRVRDEARPRHEANEAIMGLLLWGVKVFEREKSETVRPEDWRQKLATAQNQLTHDYATDDEMYRRMAMSGPAFVATICIRDHWDELSDDQRKWCATTICDAVVSSADTKDFLVRVGYNTMDGSRPTAFIISSLFGKTLPDELKERLLPTLARAVTHSVEEVVNYAVLGIASYLWRVDRALALTCLHALIAQAREKDRFFEEDRETPFDQRRPQEEFETELRQKMRILIESRSNYSEAEILDVDIAHWPDRGVARHLLEVLKRQFSDGVAVEFMKRTASTLAIAWKGGRRRRAFARRRRHDESEEDGIDSDLEHLFVDHLSWFALELDPESALEVCRPVLELTAHVPRKVTDFLNGLVLRQDNRRPTKSFWALWQGIADGCLSRLLASGPNLTNERTSSDDETLLDMLFFHLSWGEERDWEPLHGEGHRIRKFFDRLPPSPRAILGYARFLAKIGQPTLPDALCSLSAKLGDKPAGLISPESKWYLETILRRLISGGNRRIRVERLLREATLLLLDALVAAGSSVAYKLRDDFITPVNNLS
jgi:hypothetical protein